MGIVVRQASITAVFSYLGIIIGFVNIALLMNNWFTPEQYGLRSALLDIALIYNYLANLGAFRSLTKFFPYFNREGKSDQGLLSIGLITSFFGFILIGLLLLVFRQNIVDAFIDKSPLLVDYFWAILPLSFFMLYGDLIDSYLQARSRTTFSSFLKLVLVRILTTVLILLYHYEYISFNEFMVYLIAVYAFNLIIYLGYLIWARLIFFRINLGFFSKRFRKVYFNYSLYTILSSISGILATKIDILMISFFLGLSSVAIFSNAVFLSVLIYVPATTIGKISLPILSKYWKAKQIDRIDVLYKKSSINQFLVGGTILVLIWSNIDNIFSFQQEIYLQGKSILLMIGLARVLSMASGVNSLIINMSKYYRYDTITIFCLGLFTVISNLILIPIWGIEGAAFATALSMVLFDFVRIMIVKKKLGIQPFSMNTVKACFGLILSLLVGLFLPIVSNVYADIAYRTIILITIISSFTLYFNVSEDVSRLFKKGLKKLKNN